jgi:flagellar biosynthetic protein FliP
MKHIPVLAALVLLLCIPLPLEAQTVPGAPAFPSLSTEGTMSIPAPPADPVIPFIDLTVRNPQSGQEVAFSIQLLLLITILSLAPSIIILMTSFLRISIVLDFIKRALSLQQVPPNQVILGISLFLTIFIMWPTFQTIYDNSFQPLAQGEINVETAYRQAEAPLRIFMYRQMAGRPENIRLFMSMGMIMLPPVMISMPFKLILFILVDGWGLLTDQIVRSFI